VLLLRFLSAYQALSASAVRQLDDELCAQVENKRKKKNALFLKLFLHLINIYSMFLFCTGLSLES